MIKTEDLEEAVEALRYASDVAPFMESPWPLEAAKPLQAELHRRKHGPFTLAEAIASGRPFHRRGSGTWLRSIDDDYEFRSGVGFVPLAPGFIQAKAEDILATDYELMPEGGER